MIINVLECFVCVCVNEKKGTGEEVRTESEQHAKQIRIFCAAPKRIQALFDYHLNLFLLYITV